jgi:hypothetical protein
LQGIAKETIKLSESFPIEEQIEIMQGLYLTYQKENSNPDLLQLTLDRLTALQELAK